MGTLFSGIFDSELVSVISFSDFMLCMMCALVVGLILAGMYMYKNQYTKSFVATLALLPAIVCAVIMMVNGNVGTGVAVAGAFSLVRFRSAPGSAREIGAILSPSEQCSSVTQISNSLPNLIALQISSALCA